MKLRDIRGNSLGVIRTSRTARRNIAIHQNGHTIGVPIDSITAFADQLVDLAEKLDQENHLAR